MIFTEDFRTIIRMLLVRALIEGKVQKFKETYLSSLFIEDLENFLVKKRSSRKPHIDVSYCERDKYDQSKTSMHGVK